MTASTSTIALVTGGNAGIGFDTVAALASQPNYHIYLGSRSLTKGSAALEQLNSRNLPSSISVLQLEIKDDDSIAAAVATVEKEHGRLDVLINNAGVVVRDRKGRDEYRETFEVNTISHAMMTDAFKDLLYRSQAPGGARLIYVTSELGSLTQQSTPGSPYRMLPATAYRMSKAALNMLCACHVAEFEGAEREGKSRIRVWTYCPGFVVTDLTGVEDRERRVQMGAGSSVDSARGILGIVKGERDDALGGFVNRDGVLPW